MNKPIKLYFNIMLLVLVLMSCGEEEFEGSGNVVSVIRETDPFTAIEANDAMEVNISQAPTHRVEITADDNLQNQIRTQVLEGTLVISLAEGSFNKATLIVNIQVPDLERIQLNDATRTHINLVTDQLSLVLNDASSLILEGSSDVLNVNTDNASMTSGFSFISRAVNVTAQGASVLEITCSEELNGVVRDAARILYKGTPEIDVRTSDAGRVRSAN